MSAGTWDAAVRSDIATIQARAMTLYALAEPNIPWPAAGLSLTQPFLERAARELWEEGALILDPSEPYYENERQN